MRDRAEAKDQPQLADLTLIKDTLKTLCREKGIDRHFAEISKIADILMSLWRDGAHTEAELLSSARERIVTSQTGERIPPEI